MRLSRYFSRLKQPYVSIAITLPNPETAMNHPPVATDHQSLESYIEHHAPLPWQAYRKYHADDRNGIPRLSKHKALELFVSSGVSPQAVLEFNRLCQAKGWV